MKTDKANKDKNFFTAAALIWPDEYGIADSVKINAMLDTLERHKKCVYCGEKMNIPRIDYGRAEKDAQHEHIDNDGPATEENICLCCNLCNKAKLDLSLPDWIVSPICRKRGSMRCSPKGLNQDEFAPIIKTFLANHPNGHI